MAVSSDRSIEINGEFYAVDKVPDERSSVVLAEKRRLLGAVDLETLVNDLGRVGGFIRIAYNGVGAAGSKFTAEQIAIQQLGYDITKLCDKSALTVSRFKTASNSVLEDLQSTYEYLLDNLEAVALDTLSSVTKIAEDMKNAALELKTEFEGEASKVKATLEKTQVAKGDEDQRIKEKEKERIGWEESLKKEAQLIKEQKAEEENAEERRRELELQEDKAVAKIGEMGFIRELLNAVTTMKIGRPIFSTDGAEKKADTIKKARLKALEAEQAIREKRHEAIGRMSEFTAQIRQCTTEANMADIAVNALHHAVGALKHLSLVMNQAALFWEQMQYHCKSLAEAEVTSQVEKALKLPEKSRHKLWTSVPFKRKAINFYAKWVALHGVCDVYMERIKITQKDLYRYLAENPTWKQSRENIKEMAEHFLSDLKQEQKAISDRESEAQEEMKALKESEED